ncbi:4-hydroxy-tetrahydrodipicolinate synthase [uncultured Veillonella sp.]|uniref:4-hydroxy-tetrahydrodipicolinate synthase n=1 Tax=uncultured Veillonella sp. TaxID=159268 RepID=UPI0025D3E68D|nr:4-hydroxy-tetrahydrodipicolinate synthase [uncultured Veillonella sp.]MDY3974368.1 4-hydroxy-tetrahydrodipicolinate synthase [Veillonella caviae]
MKTLGRVLTAMITPFTADGAVDFDGAVKLAKHLLANGSDGLIVCGTTGESPTIDNDDKLKLFQRIASECGDLGTIVANTGSNNTARSVEFTAAASKTGVHAVMAVVPYYNKPNQEGCYLHFKAIAEATDLPVIVYNVPGRTGGAITPETIARLNKVAPNICAVKEASGDIAVAQRIYHLLPEGFMIYSGDDALTLPMIAIGGLGIISVAGHIVGREMNDMIKAYEAGDIAKAKEINEQLQPIFKAMFVTTNPIPVKYAVRKLGLPAGPFRLPMCEPSEAEKAVVDEALVHILNK